MYTFAYLFYFKDVYISQGENCKLLDIDREKFLSFLGGLSLHLNHLIASRLGICYRQFATLPFGIFLSKFGLKTAWHISYDILWSLLTYVNFWQLQGRLSTFAKIRGPQKIKVLSMKERSVVNKGLGF